MKRVWLARGQRGRVKRCEEKMLLAWFDTRARETAAGPQLSGE